jgi:flagellar basal body rod protein FlgG
MTSSLGSIAASGMNVAQTRLNTSAHNIANTVTEGFRRHGVVQAAQSGGGVQATVTQSPHVGSALETDVVDQLQAKNSFLANLSVFKTSSKMAGVLLNQKA